MKTYILYIDREKSIEYANECLESCNRFNLNAVLFQGVCDKTNRELMRKYGYKINTDMYASEYCTTIGHINAWKEIAGSNEVGVVFEHDCIVKADYSNIECNDGELVVLGPLVCEHVDYEFPLKYLNEVDKIDVQFFKGAHAYAITPKTAQIMLDELDRIGQILMPIDGLLGLRNKFNLDFKMMDPPFVVSEVGLQKVSYNFTNEQRGNTYAANREYFPKFLEGMKISKLLPTENRFFTSDTFSEHIPHWSETFKITNKNFLKPTNILQVGAFEGMSTCHISDNFLRPLESRLEVVDSFEGKDAEETQKLQYNYVKNLALSKNSEKISSYQGDSRHYLPIFIKENNKYDFIYIDNDHKMEKIIIDVLCAYFLLKDDGVIIINHYDISYVKEALDKVETMVPIKSILTGKQISYIINK
jgi:hypothetical protein